MIYAPPLRFSGLEVTRLTTLVFTDINNLELYGNIPGYKVDKCSKVRCGHPIDAYVEYFSIQMTWHLKGKVSEAVSEWVRRLINIINYRTSAPIEALEMQLNVPLGNYDRSTDRQTDLQERVEDLQIGVALAFFAREIFSSATLKFLSAANDLWLFGVTLAKFRCGARSLRCGA